MWLDLVVFGTFWFWAIPSTVVAIIIWLLWMVDDVSSDDQAPLGFAVAIWVLCVAGVLIFTDVGKLVHLAALAWGLGAYVFVGVVWSFKKWYSFVIAKLKYYQDHTYFRNYASLRPTAKKNKTLIMTWMVLWPFSMSWWVLTWPRHFFNWVYNRLSTVYDRISNNIWEQALDAAKK